jgi:hypothetical protein
MPREFYVKTGGLWRGGETAKRPPRSNAAEKIRLARRKEGMRRINHLILKGIDAPAMEARA